MDAKLSQQPYLAWQDWRWDHPQPGSACGHRVTHSHPGSPLPTGTGCSLSGALQPIHAVPRVASLPGSCSTSSPGRGHPAQPCPSCPLLSCAHLACFSSPVMSPVSSKGQGVAALRPSPLPTLCPDSPGRASAGTPEGSLCVLCLALRPCAG